MNRFEFALPGLVLNSIGRRTLPEIAFADLSIQECVSALEAHGMPLPPRTDDAYVFSVGGRADINFVSYDGVPFGARGMVNSWLCGTRMEGQKGKLNVVFLSTNHSSPLIGDFEHQHVAGLHPKSEVRVRHDRAEDDRFVLLEVGTWENVRERWSRFGNPDAVELESTR